MKTLWLTYSWKDDEDQVSFIQQELERKGLKVKRDKWTLVAGQRLWEQIEHHISNKEESDGWAIYLTANSLMSQPCKEELSYALDQALNRRGQIYPLIGISDGNVDSQVIPKSIATRLYVSLKDAVWAERVISGMEGISVGDNSREIAPYFMKYYAVDPTKFGRRYAIEVRPRCGNWVPYFVGVRAGMRERLNPYCAHGLANQPPDTSFDISPYEQLDDSRQWWVMGSQNEISWGHAAWLFVNELPGELIFGSKTDKSQQFSIKRMPGMM
ncbi:TIR domain-containing protein [Prosthecobacter fusiformis]|uniref:TIR domain-containing protein n=1 Tax=Prosthecobacter fusiformis TaxID=48464 RepID=A0A4V3FIB0_9BACT|nr:toll/interleukin-1 receptor domain-containing protein [Prosthecobacter fusiformis]TDU81783.1 TIR domain-containing protein [Prosthecobacter fusiformis]